MAVAEIAKGRDTAIMLGNLNAKRDWGHARDYVRGMWLMLQQDGPDDYVLATGETRSVREFVTKAFSCIDRTIRWEGEGLEERGVDDETGVKLVGVDPRFFRPAEVDHLLGDASKARTRLGWVPQISFAELVEEMVKSDLERTHN